MAKMGKKGNSVSCFCDSTSNGEGIKCECWDSKGNPMVMANRLVLRRKKKGRYTP
ncbi:hypothetical protein LCGC14_2158780, partial [marine sediment metagenome]